MWCLVCKSWFYLEENGQGKAILLLILSFQGTSSGSWNFSTVQRHSMLEILIVNLWNPATPTSWRGSFLRSTTMAAPIRRGHGVFVDYSFSVRLANRIFRDISKFKNAGIYCCCCTLAKKRCNSCIWNALRSEVSTRKFQLQWQCSMSDTVTAANSRLQTGRRSPFLLK